MQPSNYPPGVSGLEPQIAGYDEFEVEQPCPLCEREYTMVGHRISRDEVSYRCPGCHLEFEVDTSWDD